MAYTKKNTLSEILLHNLKTVSIFEKHEINYCIDGRKTLEEVCKSANINLRQIISELNKINGVCVNNVKFNEWGLDFLCDYIIKNHHTYIRQTYPGLLNLLREVVKPENEDNIAAKFEKLNTEFEIHMQKEERLLFPYIKKLVNSGNAKAEFEVEPFGLIEKPIEVMAKEHASAIGNLKSLKDICRKKRNFVEDNKRKRDFTKLLKEFEYDIHIHIHFENNLLFPKALLLEKKILKKSFKK